MTLPVTIASLVLGAALAALSRIDARTGRIPDAISLPLAALGLAWGYWSGLEPWTAHLLGAAAGYGSLAAFGALYFRLRGREGLGLGDAKLFAAGGAWLGWSALPLVLLIASVAALVFALLTRRGQAHAELAFGPWLATGIAAVWLLRL